MNKFVIQKIIGFYTVKKILVLLPLIFIIANCSGVKNTREMSADEHFNYAKEIYDDEDYSEAQIEFQSVLLRFPGNEITDDAQYYFGMSYFNDYKYLNAAYEFSKLIRDIPGSQFVPEAQFMLAESYYELSPPSPLEQSYTEKAIDEYQAFIEFFPVNPKVAGAENKIKELTLKLAEKEFNSAIIYEKMEYYTASIKYFTRVFEQYHDTKYAPLALYRKINLLVDKDKNIEAIKNIRTYISRYSEDENVQELKELEESLLNQ